MYTPNNNSVIVVRRPFSIFAHLSTTRGRDNPTLVSARGVSFRLAMAVHKRQKRSELNQKQIILRR